MSLGEFTEAVMCLELACLMLADHNILGLKLPLYNLLQMAISVIFGLLPLLK